MHLGLPGCGLCIVSCITNSMEGESCPVSRRETDNTATDLGLLCVCVCVCGGACNLTMSAALSAGLAFN